ncbi:MAG: PKD domain-containing protein [Candidatus Zixiibacteriota bacterium]|nr:MAG: PKD domain-containing protein [candidate division Zixibacteria bacterium]
MNIKRLLLLIVLSAMLLVAVQIGCDDLITERVEITEAGHPIADFGAVSPSVRFCCAPCEVTFKDSSDGPRHVYIWWFGDGDSLIDYLPEDPIDYVPPVHTYETAGIYTVALKVIDTVLNTEDIEIKDNFITVGTPSTDFVALPGSGCAGLEVSFVLNEYSMMTTYEWDFGDGSPTTSTLNPKHVFEDTGTFTVTLTATDDCGDQSSSADIVIGQCPEVKFGADVTAGCRPLDVQFQDSTDLFGKTYVGQLWLFGDGGSSTEINPTHLYTAAGSYTVTLSVETDQGESTDSIVGFINVADTTMAAFSIEGDESFCWSPYRQFQVYFQSHSVGAFDSLRWYFGDGFTDTGSHPIHAYVDPGFYTCTLAAYGPCGADTLVKDSFIILSDEILDENTVIVVDTTTGTGDIASSFTFSDGSTTSVITNWQWFLGSTIVSNAASFDTTLDTAGTYSVLLVTSNDCGSASDAIVLVVPPTL